MFLHHVNNIEHNIKEYLCWHRRNPSYTSMILYIKIVTLKNDASNKITNFQSDPFFQEHPHRMKILNFIFYIIAHSTYDQLFPYLKQNPKKCLTTH